MHQSVKFVAQAHDLLGRAAEPLQPRDLFLDSSDGLQ